MIIITYEIIPFSVEFVNINLIDKPEWYFEKNPKGTVPCIEQDDKIIWDSALVAEYLDASYPGPLKPTDAYQWGRQQLIFRKYDDCVSVLSDLFFIHRLKKKEKTTIYIAKTIKEVKVHYIRE